MYTGFNVFIAKKTWLFVSFWIVASLLNSLYNLSTKNVLFLVFDWLPKKIMMCYKYAVFFLLLLNVVTNSFSAHIGENKKWFAVFVIGVNFNNVVNFYLLIGESCKIPNQYADGRCVWRSNCPQYLQIFQPRNLTTATISFMRKVQCEVDANDDDGVVCCPAPYVPYT